MSSKFAAAAGEIKKFRQMFGALFALGDRLEEIGELEAEAKMLESRLSFLKDREAKLVAAGTLEKAIADLEARVADLRGEEEKLLKVKELVEEAKKKLVSLEETLKDRGGKLDAMETRIAEILKKL